MASGAMDVGVLQRMIGVEVDSWDASGWEEEVCQDSFDSVFAGGL